MDNQAASSDITHIQKLLAIVGGVIAPIFIVYTFTKSPEPTPEPVAAVEARIKPAALVEVSAETGPHIEKGGEEIVKGVCSACHAVGAMGSPKLGDKGAWAPRIAQGYITLTKHATEGIRMMPARGGNADLTDNEMASAVAYMANEAGAKFVAPKAVEATPAEPAPAK